MAIYRHGKLAPNTSSTRRTTAQFLACSCLHSVFTIRTIFPAPASPCTLVVSGNNIQSLYVRSKCSISKVYCKHWFLPFWCITAESQLAICLCCQEKCKCALSLGSISDDVLFSGYICYLRCRSSNVLINSDVNRWIR